VGFFRGVNVAGHNKVPMVDLRSVLGDAGFGNVATLIQSGNIVFDSPLLDSKAAAKIHQLVLDSFAVDTPVIVRSRAEIAAALAVHPWSPGEYEAKFHQIYFLADTPAPEGEAELAERALDEDVAVIGDELHVRYRRGQARSKLTIGLVERRLRTSATGRNLATVEKVLALLDG